MKKWIQVVEGVACSDCQLVPPRTPFQNRGICSPAAGSAAGRQPSAEEHPLALEHIWFLGQPQPMTSWHGAKFWPSTQSWGNFEGLSQFCSSSWGQLVPLLRLHSSLTSPLPNPTSFSSAGCDMKASIQIPSHNFLGNPTWVFFPTCHTSKI